MLFWDFETASESEGGYSLQYGMHRLFLFYLLAS